MILLVSACLLGEACRYDGGANASARVLELAVRHTLIPFCPELAGGLAVPRPPAEQRGNCVCTADGLDVTDAFLRGAAAALHAALQSGCTAAILKARSPSCGSGRIYDGSFTGTLTDGWGLAAALLRENGIPVYDENAPFLF